jgi:hypothetical protein
MVHLGTRSFEEIAGEVVQTSSFILQNSYIKKYESKYVRLVDYNSQKSKEKNFIKRNNHIKLNRLIFPKFQVTHFHIGYQIKSKRFLIDPSH